MNKKAIAILGAIFILIVGALGFLIYSKYYGNKTPAPGNVTANNATSTHPSDGTAPTPPPNPSPTPSPTPDPNSKTPSSNIIQLTDDQVVSPALFNDGLSIKYFDRQGNSFVAGLDDYNGKLDLSGKKQLDIPLKSGISKILWPPKGEDFIVQARDVSGKTGYSYYSRSTNTYTDLPPQVISLDWMPGGDKIMYIWLENGKASLAVGDPDAKNYKTVAEMWENDDEIRVSPAGNQALYYEINSASSTNKINSVTADGKVWKSPVASGQNFGALWSPDSQKFLFAKKDPGAQKYQLWVYNVASAQTKNLDMFTTVDKAVWNKDSNVIYVSVPASGDLGENSLTIDSIFRADTETLERKEYAVGSPSVDGRDLFLNPAGDRLFFRNAQDGGLYYLDLTQ